MTRPWTDSVTAQLLATAICPRCRSANLGDGVCRTCGADLRGPDGAAVWQASLEVAEALQRREEAIDRLPTVARESVPAAASPAPADPPADTGDTAQATPGGAVRPTSQVSLQSVLAAAGAGLFAVAAIVFTFFNPDLTDFVTRTVIIGTVTALFLAGAWLLARRGLQFSAESIGALGVVFVGLDVWSVAAEGTPAPISGFLSAFVGTLVGSAGLLALARRARIRVWLWASTIGFTIAPALLGYALSSDWLAAAGEVAALGAGLAVLALLPRLGRPFSSPLRAERDTVTALQILALAIVLARLPFLPPSGAALDTLGRSALLAAPALGALLSARFAGRRFWSFTSGALFTAAGAVLPFAFGLRDGVWYVTLVPAAAALALAALLLTRRMATVAAPALRAGGVVVAVAATVPAACGALVQLLTPALRLLLGGRGGGRGFGWVPLVSSDWSLASMLALVVFAAGLAVLYRGVPRPVRAPVPSPTGTAADAPTEPAAPEPVAGAPAAGGSQLHPAHVVALSTAALAVTTFAGWPALALPARVTIALAIAALLAGALVRIPGVLGAPRSARFPFVVTAHTLVLLSAIVSWLDSALTVPAGVAVVAVLAVVARTTPGSLRFLYVGVGYAYSLGIFAVALGDAGLGTIPLLCLTTTLASVAALVVSLLEWPGVRSWYAVLLVTAVPFLFGVGSVLATRSGWTALSTAVTFALALALVVTRRQGLTRVLRAGAAALLVPSIAVVLVCLGAEVLAGSASPVTLPLIALVVACVLPSRNLIAAGLLRRGLPDADVRAAVLWIELSSLVTAALAVVLALVRDAAGLGTTFLVLLLLGLGAAATGLFARRRYGWWVAGASWTGALWCVWAIAGIAVVEPYLLPPALAAALVGFVLSARRAPALGLYAIGLACAVLPTIGILSVVGSSDISGSPSGVAWRAYGLLGAALLLVALGATLRRRPAASHLHPLVVPTLLAAIAAAAGGAVQAVRFGLGRDPLDLVDDELVMLPVLALSIAATVLAGAAAALLLASPARRALAALPRAGFWFDRPRWLYVPASLYLVAGPIAAIRPGWFPIWTLWSLALVVLALMLVTVGRARRGDTALPPVWFTFLLAWCTAVAGWSERELRVEAFSLPLGLGLLAAGVLAARGRDAVPDRPAARLSPNAWPVGFRGSWWLFGPGIVVTILPSVLATGTDPLTQRAILVIALALASILVGLLRRQAAPFLLGLIVLPVENVLVFVVQIGRSISAAPWWITLATAGAVLLVLAVGYERRSAKGGVAARLRDLA